MFLLIKIILLAGQCAPLFLFLDYHKRSNIHYALIYVAVFALTIALVLRLLIQQFHLYFAMAIPFLMVLFLLMAKKKG